MAPGRPTVHPLQRQRWTPVTRVFLTVGRRFWGPGPAGRQRLAGRPLDARPGTGGGPGSLDGPRGGGGGARVGLPRAGRAAWARAEAARVFPEWVEAASAEALSHCWDQDPFAGGGYPWPAPGDASLPGALAAPEGRLHFAGEQTTHRFG